MTTPTPSERASTVLAATIELDHYHTDSIVHVLEDACFAIIDAAELSALRAEAKRQQRIIAGLRRAVVVMAADARLLDGCLGATRSLRSAICELERRADAIRAAAKRGEYRKP